LALSPVSLDLIVALIATSLLRRRLGYRLWRFTHWAAYLSWPVAFAHSVGMGSDVPSLWFRVLAIGCLATVIAATATRFVLQRAGKRLEPQVVA